MSKQLTVLAEQTKSQDFNDIASAKKFTSKALMSYNMTSQLLHIAACWNLFLSSAHARTENLGTLYDGLNKNDKTALRIWVGKLASYEVLVEGVATKKHWIEFDSKAETSGKRWKIKKGTEEIRQASIASDKEQLLLQKPFNLKENVHSDDPFTMVDMLGQIKRFVKTLESKAEKNDLTIPANINEQLKALALLAG